MAHLIPPLSDVDLDHGVGVDGIADVGVDDHAEEAGVGLQGGRTFHLQGDPSGWLQPPVDISLEDSGNWWAATVATNCPTAQVRWRN